MLVASVFGISARHTHVGIVHVTAVQQQGLNLPSLYIKNYLLNTARAIRYFLALFEGAA